jgi:hypothetical protein
MSLHKINPIIQTEPVFHRAHWKRSCETQGVKMNNFKFENHRVKIGLQQKLQQYHPPLLYFFQSWQIVLSFTYSQDLSVHCSKWEYLQQPWTKCIRMGDWAGLKFIRFLSFIRLIWSSNFKCRLGSVFNVTKTPLAARKLTLYLVIIRFVKLK